MFCHIFFMYFFCFELFFLIIWRVDSDNELSYMKKLYINKLDI